MAGNKLYLLCEGDNHGKIDPVIQILRYYSVNR